jgi:hypothetical protein
VNRVSKDAGTLDLKIAGLDEYIVVETKSPVDYTDVNNYDVVIDGPTKYEAKFGTMRGDLIELGSGSYTITVTSPSTEPAAFEQPIYQAYESFVIKAGEVTPLDLVCTPKNCKVTIELSENFVKELATYEVVVSNGLGELTWIKNTERNDFSEGKAGYFLPRGLEIKVKGYRSIDNTEATAVHFVADPQPAEHHIVKLDAKVTGQIGGITIDVNTDFNDREQNVDIPGLDEEYVDRPDFGDGDEGEDDEDETPQNTIEWPDNPTFDKIVLNENTQIKMNISMPAGIATFIVEVSDNFKQLVSVITTGGVDYLDLINDEQIKTNFADSALPTGDELLNQTNVEFDLTSFVSMLMGAMSNGGTVSFILKATDANGDPLLFMDDYPTVVMEIPASN